MRTEDEADAARFDPAWASALAIIALVVAVGCLSIAVRFLFLLFAGESYGIVFVLGALVMVALAMFVGLPTVGYLRTRRRRLFTSAMVSVGLVVAVTIAFVVHLKT